MNIQDVTERVDDAAAMMSALSHPARLLVLCRLVEGELSVGSLAQMAELSPLGTVSTSCKTACPEPGENPERGTNGLLQPFGAPGTGHSGNTA